MAGVTSPREGPKQPALYTIGHSNHSLTRFLELLSGAGIAAIADVRSQPVSRFAPQFNKDALIRALEAGGIAYAYMGRELGGRPKDAGLLTGGKPDYEKMARADAFRDGLARLAAESATHRLAILCAERDPTDCHRFLLVARALAAQGIEVAHILANGDIETQEDTERRMRALKPQADLFG
jgi:uncharacterized protein (DUF488 family)